MKRLFILYFVCAAFFAACSKSEPSMKLAGKSDHWLAYYSETESDQNIIQTVEIRYIGNEELPVPLSYSLYSTTSPAEWEVGGKAAITSPNKTLTQTFTANKEDAEKTKVVIQINWNDHTERFGLIPNNS